MKNFVKVSMMLLVSQMAMGMDNQISRALIEINGSIAENTTVKSRFLNRGDQSEYQEAIRGIYEYFLQNGYAAPTNDTATLTISELHDDVSQLAIAIPPHSGLVNKCLESEIHGH